MPLRKPGPNQGCCAVDDDDDTMSRLGNPYQRDSNIDLMFAKDSLLDKMNYGQCSDTWGSDHFSIIFELGVNKRMYKKNTNRLSTKKTKWSDYYAYLEKEEKKLDKVEFSEAEADKKYTYFINMMKDAVKIATYGKQMFEEEKKMANNNANMIKKKEYTSRRRNPVSWWDAKC